jgi:hypothetical protein
MSIVIPSIWLIMRLKEMYLIDCMRAELADRKHRINIHSMLCVGSGMIKNKDNKCDGTEDMAEA